eukprot:PhM_4_TR5903/c0_g1_i6/m.7623
MGCASSSSQAISQRDEGEEEEEHPIGKPIESVVPHSHTVGMESNGADAEISPNPLRAQPDPNNSTSSSSRDLTSPSGSGGARSFITATPTTPSTTTHDWKVHRCPWVGWCIRVPPTWTHERTAYLNGVRIITVLRDPKLPDIAVHVTTTRTAPPYDRERLYRAMLAEVLALPGLQSHVASPDEAAVSYVVENTLGEDSGGMAAPRLEGFRRLRTPNCLHVFDVAFCAPDDRYFQLGPIGNLIVRSFEGPPTHARVMSE